MENKVLRLPEKLEFGNPEHIKAVKQSEERFDKLKKGVEICHYNPEWNDWENMWEAKSNFRCVCGERVEVAYNGSGEEEDEPEEIDMEPEKHVKCHRCNREYEIDFPIDACEWQVKLIIEE